MSNRQQRDRWLHLNYFSTYIYTVHSSTLTNVLKTSAEPTPVKTECLLTLVNFLNAQVYTLFKNPELEPPETWAATIMQVQSNC
jgi:hypothetical protein